MIRAEPPRRGEEQNVREPMESVKERHKPRHTVDTAPRDAELLKHRFAASEGEVNESSLMHPDSTKNARQSSPAQASLSPGAITCSQCGMENAAGGGRRFCGECGSSLWEKCHGCDADVPVDERFCGHCGVNMVEGVQQQIRSMEDHFARVQRLERNHRFSEAIMLLASIARNETPRLKDFAAAAEEKLKHLRHEHARWEGLAEAAHKKAKEAAVLNKVHEAFHALQEIPPAVHSEPMQKLFQELRTRKDEIDALSEHLRSLLAEKRGGEVQAVVERLQYLQPNHPLASKVAQRIGEQLTAKARDRIAQRRYDDAMELLRRMPSSVQTAETDTLLGEVSELSSLVWDANHCPYMDDGLAHVLKRLLRKLPEDDTVRKLAAEYQKRRNLLEDPERTDPVRWAKAAGSAWECPVEWMTAPMRIEMEGVPAEVRRGHPGVFAVAFGLALQGIGKGPVRIDFREAGVGVLGRMAKIMREKRAGSAWGIDIGDHSLKAVRLEAVGGGQRVVANACEVISHEKLLSQAANYGEARDIAEGTFDQFRNRHRLQGERLCLALPARLTICKALSLPAAIGGKTEDAVRFEARRVLSDDLANYRWRGYALDSSDVSATGQTYHVLLALTRHHLEQLDGMFERLRIQPDLLQTEYLALHNYLGFELAAKAEGNGSKGGATVLLDVGSGGTCMIAQSSQHFWGRYLGAGGHSLARAVVREFALTLREAEKWIHDPSHVDCWNRWESALGSVFEGLKTEIDAAMAVFLKECPGEQITRIVTVGGAVQTHGLLRFFQTGR